MNDEPPGQDSGNSTSVYRVPSSSYRLQLNSEFTFQNALEITQYLRQLGISDCYASPVFRAGPGSTHGYDVCDFNELNPVLGSMADFERWTTRLHELGMGLLLDMVPNHMGADPSNPWWRDVLENGEASHFARWFDINWNSSRVATGGRVVIPILEDRYWKVLESGKVRVIRESNRFALAYYQQVLPLSPASQHLLESELFRMCAQETPDPAVSQNAAPARRLSLEARSHGRGGGAASFDFDDKEFWKSNEADPELAESLDRALGKLNGALGAPESFELLDRLLQVQNYRLTYWRLANEEVNYRRFFDVSGLVSLRAELWDVFEATHKLVLRWIREGKVTGLRIDHIDGLLNPRQYLVRLQQALTRSKTAQSTQGRGGIVSADLQNSSLYVVAEKILSDHETLPEDWPVAGTTGYDFLNVLNGLFINSFNGTMLARVYGDFLGRNDDFADLVFCNKQKILRTSFRGDLLSLTQCLRAIASGTRYGVDFSFSELETALGAFIAAFPVYRTYVNSETKEPTAMEKAYIQRAARLAREQSSVVDPEVLSFVEKLLLLSPPNDLDETTKKLSRQFVMRFQQLTGPVMAKGLEDTTFYGFNRLVSPNEVGGNPATFGTDLERFHQQNGRQVEHWPHTLLATATHDTKRGEDARARLNVLSEMPEEWGQALAKWKTLNAVKKTTIEGRACPDANDEYLFYQSLVGAWLPQAEKADGLNDFRTRLSSYMLKAVREAKSNTSWTEPNLAYERATQKFVEGVLDHSSGPFLDDFMLFHRKITVFALFNSLAQVVLKMTAPGVPDFYQGTELWDFNLVDPDNRRPVDYTERKRLLGELIEKLAENPLDMTGFLKGLLQNHQNGQIKLYLIWRILQYRQAHRSLFAQGSYEAIYAQGSKREHICAFARNRGQESLLTVAARLLFGLAKGAQRAALEPDLWQDTVLPMAGQSEVSRYRDLLSGQIHQVQPCSDGLPVRDVLRLLPVAVLERI